METVQFADVSINRLSLVVLPSAIYLSFWFLLAHCPNLYDPDHGSVSANGLSIGHTANYSCNDGHELVGDATITCQTGGVWSSKPPVCIGKMLHLF